MDRRDLRTKGSGTPAVAIQHGRMPFRMVAVVSALLAACSAPWAQRSVDASGLPLPCAALAGRATRTALCTELGSPQRVFPLDGIAMWRLLRQGDQLVPFARRSDVDRTADHTLVVEFDAQGTVQRWHLVQQS